MGRVHSRLFRPRVHPGLLVILAVVIALGAGAAALSRSHPAAPSPGQASTSDDELNRRRLDQLVNEQKFEEAAKEAARLREAARRAKNEPAWAWALIKEVQVRTALHGYETSVRFLKDETWPKGALHRAALR